MQCNTLIILWTFTRCIWRDTTPEATIIYLDKLQAEKKKGIYPVSIEKDDEHDS